MHKAAVPFCWERIQVIVLQNSTPLSIVKERMTECKKMEASERRNLRGLAAATMPNGFGGGAFSTSGLCEAEVRQHGGD